LEASNEGRSDSSSGSTVVGGPSDNGETSYDDGGRSEHNTSSDSTVAPGVSDDEEASSDVQGEHVTPSVTVFEREIGAMSERLYDLQSECNSFIRSLIARRATDEEPETESANNIPLVDVGPSMRTDTVTNPDAANRTYLWIIVFGYIINGGISGGSFKLLTMY